MDTLPDEIYQHIFGYLLSDDVYGIFSRSSLDSDYRLQFVNKTFQRNFRNYIKTSPLDLKLWYDEWSLKLAKLLKKSDAIGIYSFDLEIGYCKDGIGDDIIKTLDGINFTSLRELILEGLGKFDLEVLKGCKELTSITLGLKYATFLDEIQREKMKTFLSFNKHTVECLRIPLRDDIVPNDLVNWPKLKQLTITDTSVDTKVIESSTLQELCIYENYFPCNIVIKCPNLKVLQVVHDRVYCSDDSEDTDGLDDDIELVDRSLKDHYDNCPLTCHPSELRKFGIEIVEISSNCDIAIDMGDHPLYGNG